MPNRALPPLPLRLAWLLAATLAAPGIAAEAPDEALSAAGIAPPPAAERRERFQDWELGCGRGCRLTTALQGAAGEVVLELAVTPGAAGPMLVIATPMPLYLPDPLALALGARPEVPLPWHTCGPAGCEVRARLTPELLEGLRREREAMVSFTLVDGVRVRLPVSLMGFTAGERALSAASPPA